MVTLGFMAMDGLARFVDSVPTAADVWKQLPSQEDVIPAALQAIATPSIQVDADEIFSCPKAEPVETVTLEDVKAKQSEFADVVRFFSVYMILSSSEDPNSFKEIMRQVLDTAKDETDLAKQSNLRRDQFLELLMNESSEPQERSQIGKLFHDIYMWFKKIPARVLLSVFGFYAEQFVKNGADALHAKLLSVGAQMQTGKETTDLNIEHITNTTRGLSNIVNAWTSWAQEGQSGDASTYINATLARATKREELYKESGRLAIKTYVTQEFNLLSAPFKRLSESLSRAIAADHFESNIANRIARFFKYLAIEPARLIVCLAHTPPAIIDRLIHSLVMNKGSHFLNENLALLEMIIDGSCHAITKNRFQYLSTKTIIRDQMKELVKTMEAPSSEKSDPFHMPAPMRRELEKMISSLAELIRISESKTQSEALKSEKSWIESQALSLSMASIVDITGQTIEMCLDESQVNMYLAKGLEVSSNALTGLAFTRDVSNAELAKVDREIQELSEQIIRAASYGLGAVTVPAVRPLIDRVLLLSNEEYLLRAAIDEIALLPFVRSDVKGAKMFPVTG